MGGHDNQILWQTNKIHFISWTMVPANDMPMRDSDLNNFNFKRSLCFKATGPRGEIPNSQDFIIKVLK